MDERDLSVSCRTNPHSQLRTCDECPWRTDVAVGRFSAERFIQLADTSTQGFGPGFACHKSPKGAEVSCVGWLLVDGPENLRVRLAAARGDIELGRLEATGPLFATYGDMAEANGVPDVVVDRLGVRSSRRHRAAAGDLEPNGPAVCSRDDKQAPSDS